MLTDARNTQCASAHHLTATSVRAPANARVREPLTRGMQTSRAMGPRLLIRPEPGFYAMRRDRGAPLVSALIYQLCPMVVPQPGVFGGPHPEDWCRPLDRSPLLRAQIDGREASLDAVWTARSLRPVSAAEYRFRLGPLRHWAQRTGMPEARSRQRVQLADLPSLF
jgi:hypothetical protein